MKIMLFQGSPRDANNCPGQDAKTKTLIKHITSSHDDIEFDVCDLSVMPDKIIQPCKGCVSTSKYHCHWPCSCYGPGSASEDLVDYMHDAKIYSRLEECDGFIVFSPIHWYGPTTQVKAMFDRLVCANMSLTREDAWDAGIKKNPKISQGLVERDFFSDKMKDHLEGKVGAFFIHGDDGADDERYVKKQKSLAMYDEANSDESSPRDAIMPIVWQCRYSGIHVPDKLIVAFHTNQGKSYAEANKLFKKNKHIYDLADALVKETASFIKLVKDKT